MTTWKPYHHEKANSLLKSKNFFSQNLQVSSVVICTFKSAACKIVYSPNRARKFCKVVAGVVPQLSVSTCKFDYEGKQVSIMEYFGRTYGLKLNYPNGPVLELKGHNKPKVPAEVTYTTV